MKRAVTLSDEAFELLEEIADAGMTLWLDSEHFWLEDPQGDREWLAGEFIKQVNELQNEIVMVMATMQPPTEEQKGELN